MKKKWIRIDEEGFESYEEHQNFPENGFEFDEQGFESVYELHVFQKVDSNLPKGDSNQ